VERFTDLTPEFVLEGSDLEEATQPGGAGDALECGMYLPWWDMLHYIGAVPHVKQHVRGELP